MKYLILFLPLFGFAQTWHMQYDHKLLPQRAYEIDTLIGNGQTLYFQCGSELKINKHVENVRFLAMRKEYERCRPWNRVIFTDSTYFNNVRYAEECIKFQGLPKGIRGNKIKTNRQ